MSRWMEQLWDRKDKTLALNWDQPGSCTWLWWSDIRQDNGCLEFPPHLQNDIVHGKGFSADCVISMLKVTSSPQLSSCCQTGENVIPASAPSCARVTSLEILLGFLFWSRVNHLQSQMSQDLNVTENWPGQSLPLGCMCVEGQRELYQAGALNPRFIISQIAQLTLHALAEQFLCNSSATSCSLASCLAHLPHFSWWAAQP